MNTCSTCWKGHGFPVCVPCHDAQQERIRLSERRTTLLRVAGELEAEATRTSWRAANLLRGLAAKYRKEAENG